MAVSSTVLPSARVDQVHGCDVVVAREAGPGGRGDALVTDRADLRLTIRVADCLPVLLAVPGAVAAVHAGWRGAAGGIAGRALAQLLAASGRSEREAVAWIGPAIATCCFEVGPEVAAAFPAAWRRAGPRRDHVDLAGAVAAQLRSAGVPAPAIDISRYCTRCHQHLWHSHRGSGGRPGRLTAWIVREGHDDSIEGHRDSSVAR